MRIIKRNVLWKFRCGNLSSETEYAHQLLVTRVIVILQELFKKKSEYIW